MTSPQDRLDDLDAMLAIAKARPFAEWDCEVIALLTNVRLRWFNKLHDSRMVSPLGDRRERSVPCADCRTSTWALDGLCARCQSRRIEAADLRTTGQAS